MAEQPKKIIVIGGSGGIGQALVQALLNEYPAVRIFATFHRRGIPFNHERLEWQKLDVHEAVVTVGAKTKWQFQSMGRNQDSLVNDFQGDHLKGH